MSPRPSARLLVGSLVLVLVSYAWVGVAQQDSFIVVTRPERYRSVVEAGVRVVHVVMGLGVTNV